MTHNSKNHWEFWRAVWGELMTGVEIKFIQRETQCFSKGSSWLSAGACLEPPLRGELWPQCLRAVTHALLQVARSESGAEQRQRACFPPGWLTPPWQLPPDEHDPWGLSILPLFRSLMRRASSSFWNHLGRRGGFSFWNHLGRPKQSPLPQQGTKAQQKRNLCGPVPMACVGMTEMGPVCWPEVCWVMAAMSRLTQPHKCYTEFTREANVVSPAPDQEPWPREVGLIKHVQTGRKHCKSGERMGRNSLLLCPERDQAENQCVCGSWQMYVQLGWFKGIDALSEHHPPWQWQTPDASEVVVKALWGKQLWNELTRM